MATVLKKRKFGDDVTKYYAVRAGKKPGVYMTWKECQENITGFKGAQFKSFTTKQEAEAFAAGKVIPGSGDSDKFYAVAVGHVPGVYENWAEASEQIKDVKGPKYKKFVTREEAEEFVRSGGKKSKQDEESNTSAKTERLRESHAEGPATKKTKSASGTSKPKTLRVYTDGSSRHNGTHRAVAGVGVYFGDHDDRNISEPLEGTEQTNNRAELTAVLRALEIVPIQQSMEIISDSSYTINCVTVWYKNWRKNGWVTSTKEPVQNKDLIMAIREILDEREAAGVKTELTWIKGHNKDPGNEAADRLAVAGASMART